MGVWQARALVGQKLRYGGAVDADGAGKGALAEAAIRQRPVEPEPKLRSAQSLVDNFDHMVINITFDGFC
jgi:hypothetical protein